jgi:subtilase family serine protease
MKSFRSWAVLASVGLTVGALALAGGISAAGAASASSSAGRTTLPGSLAPAIARGKPQGPVPGSASVGFDLALNLRDPSGAQALVRDVSDPGSAAYRHYLTDAQWEARYAPTQAAVSQASTWLRKQGFSVGAVSKDHLLVPAQGTAAQVERAFSTTLGYYEVNGETVRLANSPLSIPSSMAGTVSGTVGINQYLMTNTLAETPAPTTAPAQPAQEPPPPAGYRNPQPCSAYWGQKTDTRDSSKLYAPYTAPLSYDICGYSPNQLRAGYKGLNVSLAHGDNGTGVAIAIVDAYDSPTLLADAQHYFRLNDSTHPLATSQFFNDEPSSVDDQAVCAGSGWYDEQALDVESSHTMAPGADILFVGAKDCTDNNLLGALDTAVTSGASVVSDSWGDDLGDLFTDAATKTAFDNTFIEADVTGVSVLFSSGDTGDNFADFGLTVPNYPASSPYVTTVGGTTLEIGNAGVRLGEYGWSTASQLLCSSSTTNCGAATNPAGALGFNSGGGGGTSYYYTQPWYQTSVVPAALALRNEALFGPVPLRVEPDISMDADAQSGMLIGLTQTFPDGTYYDQFKEGGTSLASPLLAGVIADTDTAAGTSLGFLNPALYKAYQLNKAAFNDIVPPSVPDKAAVARVNYADSVDTAEGYTVFLRAINYAGPETYCDGTGNCATRPVTLTTAPGFDGMTGLGSIGPSFINVLKNF